MIQRIQTIYLFIAAVLLIGVNFANLVSFNVANGQYLMNSLGVDAFGVEEYVGPEWVCYLLPVLSCFAAYLSLRALFGYKNRIGQMRRCLYAIMVIILYYVALGVQVWMANGAIADAKILPTLYAQLPLIAIIFLFIAGRAINRDEALVRSTERIR